MDKPCGCATAEQCFAKCCCHTPTERLAWAKAHHVEAAIASALERRVAAEPRKAGAACCAAKSTKAAGTRSLDLDGPEICSEYESLAATPASLPAKDSPGPAEEPPQPRLVVLRAMLACGGIVAEWFSCGVSLPPPAIVAAIVTCEPPLITLAVADDKRICIPSVPDLPPPRA